MHATLLQLSSTSSMRHDAQHLYLYLNVSCSRQIMEQLRDKSASLERRTELKAEFRALKDRLAAALDEQEKALHAAAAAAAAPGGPAERPPDEPGTAGDAADNGSGQPAACRKVGGRAAWCAMRDVLRGAR
jgi:hypothetical protein